MNCLRRSGFFMIWSLVMLLVMCCDHGVAQEPAATPSSAAVHSSAADSPAAAHAAGVDRSITLLASITVFVIAVFLGFELINKVPPTLHTPLMSGSNAISGITVVGALIAAGTATDRFFVLALGALGVALAMINVVGGFMVTHRMLLMFRPGARGAAGAEKK